MVLYWRKPEYISVFPNTESSTQSKSDFTQNQGLGGARSNTPLDQPPFTDFIMQLRHDQPCRMAIDDLTHISFDAYQVLARPLRTMSYQQDYGLMSLSLFCSSQVTFSKTIRLCFLT